MRNKQLDNLNSVHEINDRCVIPIIYCVQIICRHQMKRLFRPLIGFNVVVVFVNFAAMVAVGQSRRRLFHVSVVIVGDPIKVDKEAEDEQFRTANHAIEEHREAAIVFEKQLGRVQDDDVELDNLDGGQILFPPDETLVARSHGSHQVIKIHNDVDESVEERAKQSVSARHVLDAQPKEDGHQSVVHHMQRGDLIVFLSQNEENCIEKVDKLGYEVPVGDVQGTQGSRLLFNKGSVIF